jgi:hypothetical protein
MLRGINYDTGFGGEVGTRSRVDLDPTVARRELEIIAADLHCDAVRITGDDPDRIALAAHAAVDVGLGVWFAPFPTDLSPAQLTPYFERCARSAEEIRARDPETVLVLGGEMSLFCRGFVPGMYLMQRMMMAMNPNTWAEDFEPEVDFNTMLRDLLGVARTQFGGRITYASGDWEEIDWSGFDFAAVDLYRSKENAEFFTERVQEYGALGKPLVITEFGCCTYRGAAAAGGNGWTVIDHAATPPRVLHTVRDESAQVAYFTELMDIFEAEDVHGAFWFTFAGYETPTDPDPTYDLDMGSYGVVKVLKGQKGGRYPDMAWEPKEVFDAMATRFGA